jgi:neutral ceramidase
MSQLRSVIALFLSFGSIAIAQDNSAHRFRAGAATSNITPPLGSPIVGNWETPPATNIHDELHSRALVLNDGRTRLAIVVNDNVGISRDVFDEAKKVIEAKTGIPRANILISSTHTHSAASARTSDRGEPLSDYQRFVASRISDAVLRAERNLRPAKIGWGVGTEASQVFNRRWKMKPGEELRNPFGGMDLVRMNPPAGHPNLIEPAGPTDPQIHFLSIQSVDGRPLALLANYSLHYVGGVPQGDISADYFAVFANRIGELLRADGQDPPFVGIMSNGTSGNINNINFRGDKARRRWQPYEKMKMVANLVAAEVFKSYQTVQHHDWVELGAAQAEIPMGVRVPGPKDIAWAESVLNRPKGSSATHVREAAYAQRAMDMKDLPRQIPLILQSLRIGDVGIAAIPAEVFVEIGLEIRKRSPFPQTFTMSLANGAYGYLPTVEQHKLGGYETWRGTNRLEIDAAPKIVEALVGLLNQLNKAK